MIHITTNDYQAIAQSLYNELYNCGEGKHDATIEHKIGHFTIFVEGQFHLHYAPINHYPISGPEGGELTEIANIWTTATAIDDNDGSGEEVATDFCLTSLLRNINNII